MWRTGISLLRGALPAVGVGSVLPMTLFYLALEAGSVGWAVAVSVCYAYGVSLWQWRARRRVSGMLLITAFMATVRAGAVLLSGLPDLWFAIPVLETAGFGLVFLATMFWGEPLVLRLARDFVPTAADGLAERRALVRSLSLVWTVTYLGSGATTMALLLALPLPVFIGAHTVTGWLWTGSGVTVSWLICRHRASGLMSELIINRDTAGRPPAAAPPLAVDQPLDAAQPLAA